MHMHILYPISLHTQLPYRHNQLVPQHYGCANHHVPPIKRTERQHPPPQLLRHKIPTIFLVPWRCDAA